MTDLRHVHSPSQCQVALAFHSESRIGRSEQKRIGNLLGAGDGKRAEDAMYVTFVICFAFMAVCGVVFAVAADVLGYVFTNDREVIAATAKIAYVAAAFQLVSLTFILIIARAIGLTSCFV